jgi:hypothetical protein
LDVPEARLEECTRQFMESALRQSPSRWAHKSSGVTPHTFRS